MKQYEINKLSLSEQVAVEYVCKLEDCNMQCIKRGTFGEPDFIAPSGKRYEAKVIKNRGNINSIEFTLLQIRNFKDDDVILVVKNNAIVTVFLWKNKKKTTLQPSIKLHESLETNKKTDLKNPVILTVEDVKEKRGYIYIPKTIRKALKEKCIKEYIIRIVKGK